MKHLTGNVKTAPRSHKIALMLCVLALCIGQILGGARGYLCDCSGNLIQTSLAECYGPHGVDCHSDETSPFQNSSGDREEHTAFSLDLKSTPADSAPLLLTPDQPILHLPAAWPEVSVQANTHATRYSLTSGHPPPVLSVKRTVVLLI